MENRAKRGARIYLGEPSIHGAQVVACVMIGLLLSSCAKSIDRAVSAEMASNSAEAVQCRGEKVTDNTPNTELPALVTSSHRVYPHRCFETILSRTLKNSAEPVVLFVSGRGRHPKKEMRQELLKKIEDQYGVTAIMFTWPSWCGYSCFPKEKARASATALHDVLRIVESLKEKDSGDRTYTLLAHSMGAFVLEGLAGLSGEELQSGLFDSIVINSAAVEHAGHARWVKKVAFGENLFITSNSKDRVLACLENDLWIIDPRRLFCRQFGLSERLGRWAVANANEYNTAENAVYVGFEGTLGRKHRYYINQETEAPQVFKFYQQVFRGDLVRLEGYEQVVPNHVYRLEH